MMNGHLEIPNISNEEENIKSAMKDQILFHTAWIYDALVSAYQRETNNQRISAEIRTILKQHAFNLYLEWHRNTAKEYHEIR
ncbi:MAG: hypothetical protein ACRBB3_10040 [Alphaproteobacteria bacterium]